MSGFPKHRDVEGAFDKISIFQQAQCDGLKNYHPKKPKLSGFPKHWDFAATFNEISTLRQAQCDITQKTLLHK